MLTELRAVLDELLAYLESIHDVREEGRPARKSPAVERLTQKTLALRDAVSAERQNTDEQRPLSKSKLTADVLVRVVPVRLNSRAADAKPRCPCA